MYLKRQEHLSTTLQEGVLDHECGGRMEELSPILLLGKLSSALRG